MPSILIEAAPGAVGPALVAGALLALGVLLGRRALRGESAVAPAVAVPAGFAVGWALLLRWPALPLAQGDGAWTWVAWFAPGGLALGWLEGFLGLPRIPALALRLAVALGATWLLLAPHAGLAPGERWTAAVVFALWIALHATALRALAKRGPAPGFVVVPHLVAAGAAAAILAFVSGSLTMGQVMGALSAALGGALGAGLLLRARAFAPAAAPALALVFGGLVLGAWAYLNVPGAEAFPATAAHLLLLGPLAGLFLASRLAPGASTLARALVAALPPALLALLAAWLASKGAPPPNPYGG